MVSLEIEFNKNIINKCVTKNSGDNLFRFSFITQVISETGRVRSAHLGRSQGAQEHRHSASAVSVVTYTSGGSPVTIAYGLIFDRL